MRDLDEIERDLDLTQVGPFDCVEVMARVMGDVPDLIAEVRRLRDALELIVEQGGCGDPNCNAYYEAAAVLERKEDAK